MLLQTFLDVKNIDEKSIHEARRIYSNLDIDEFYEWASDHFGLDIYYEDSEDLVDHIKIIFRIDDDLLDNNEDYKFVTKMIGRSEPSYQHLAWKKRYWDAFDAKYNLSQGINESDEEFNKRTKSIVGEYYESLDALNKWEALSASEKRRLRHMWNSFYKLLLLTNFVRII